MEQLIRLLKRLGHGVIVVIAILWFFIDIIFLSFIRPLRDRIMRWWWMQKVRTWVCALGPYGSLAVFAVPVLVLEPIKPLGALLWHHGHHREATMIIIAGELTKLTIVDQLFDMTKPKLMTFRWFAWAYGQWRAILDALRALRIRRIVRGWIDAVRRYMGAR